MKISLIDRLSEELISELEALPITVDYQPDIKPADVSAAILDSDVLVINSKVNVNAELMDHAPKLKMVIRAGIGLDHFDLEYAEKKGIIVKNTPGGNSDSVAEHTIGMILGLTHWIARANKEVKQFLWLRNKNRGTEIKDKTVGIIGYGNAGSRVAARLVPFGCNILAYDKYKSGFGDLSIKESNLDEIYAKADIVSLHIPLTEETLAWVNADFFSKFQRPIMFINLARGPIVQIENLIEALDTGKVISAGLDVLENEKFFNLSDHQRNLYKNLFQRDNVLLSPHVGGWSVESARNIWKMIYAYIEEFYHAQDWEEGRN